MDNTFGLAKNRVIGSEIRAADETSPATAEGESLEPTTEQPYDSEAEMAQSETDESYFYEENFELSEACLQTLGQAAQSLCSICRSFPRGEFYSGMLETYHTSLKSLGRSVDVGCSLCELLSRSLDDFCSKFKPPLSQESSWILCCNISGTAFWGNDGLSYAFYIYSRGERITNPESGNDIFKLLYFYPANKFRLGPEFSDPSIKITTAKSRMSLDLVRGWYQQCLRHTICRNWEEEFRALPTRLVYIWPPCGKASTIRAKLCDTADLPTMTKYTTLSHCWGKAAFVKLQSRDLNSFQREIPIHQLPKTFHDAMHITLKLGLHYIWIDSLCIIQDSVEDWIHESKRMGSVYRYSECTIAAASYYDGSLGLFSERRTLPYVHFPLYVEHLSVLEASTGKETRHKGFYVLMNDVEYHRKVVESVLNSRAWVAQERALSPGTLHYTREKIWWECNELIADEAFPKGGLDWELEDETFKGGAIRSIRKGERDTVYAFWRSFVGFYAGTNITKDIDRFPAATGIARIVGNLVNDNLIAGFWEGDIVRSLIWNCTEQIQGFQSVQLAPSWSWASLCGKLGGWGYDGTSLLCPLQGIQVRVLSDVSDFKSDLESTSFERSNVRGLAICGPLRKLPADLEVDVGEGPEGIHYIQLLYDNKGLDGSMSSDLGKDQEWRLKDSTHLLPLAHDDRHVVYGILLQQVPEAIEPLTFRRSGKVQFYFTKPEIRWEYLGLLEKDGKYQPSLRFEECGFQDLVLI